MIELKISLVYLIIHLLCIQYILYMWDSVNYQPDDFDKLLVFLLAPELLIVMFLGMFVKRRK